MLPFALRAYRLPSTRGSTHRPGELSYSLSHRLHNLLSAEQLLPTVTMSHDLVPTASGPSSNFRSIFDAALKDYKEKTKMDLLTHQLTVQLQDCDSPSAILDVLNRQYNIQQFVQSQSAGQGSKQWLDATVTVLCAFSAALGEGVGIVNPQRPSCEGYSL
jgi:hypothetical protein